MVIRLNIIPLNGPPDAARRVAAAVLRLSASKCLPHKETACGLLVTGEWPELLSLVRDARRRARGLAGAVMTVVQIEDPCVSPAAPGASPDGFRPCLFPSCQLN